MTRITSKDKHAFASSPSAVQKKPSSGLLEMAGKGVGILASTAAFKWVSVQAQRFSYSCGWNPSSHFPQAMKNFLDPENDLGVRLRSSLAGLVVAPGRGVPNMVVQTMVLAPIFEEVERMILHYGIEKAEKMIAKRCFGVDHFEKSTAGKVLKVALSSLISGLRHYQPAVPKEIRFDARYLNDPKRKKWVDDSFQGQQVANDTNIIGACISAIGFAVALEFSGTIVVPIALHALSNLVASTLR